MRAVAALVAGCNDGGGGYLFLLIFPRSVTPVISSIDDTHGAVAGVIIATQLLDNHLG